LNALQVLFQTFFHNFILFALFVIIFECWYRKKNLSSFFSSTVVLFKNFIEIKNVENFKTFDLI